MAAPMPRVPPVTIATRPDIVVLPDFPSRLVVRVAAVPGDSVPPFRVAGTSDAASVAGDAHGDAHAAADAQGRQPLLGITLLHFVQQRDQDPGARCADRMAERDGAAIDVDLGSVPAEVL